MNSVRANKRTMLFLVLICLMIPGRTIAQDQPTIAGGLTDSDVSDFVIRYDAVFNTPDMALIDTLFADDFVAHVPLAPDVSRAGWKTYIESLYRPFPDLKQSVNAVLIAGNHVVLNVTFTGTHQGPFFGAAATGNDWTMDGIVIFRFEGDQVAEAWMEMDFAGLIFQTRGVSPDRVSVVPADYDANRGMAAGVLDRTTPALAPHH